MLLNVYTRIEPETVTNRHCGNVTKICQFGHADLQYRPSRIRKDTGVAQMASSKFAHTRYGRRILNAFLVTVSLLSAKTDNQHQKILQMMPTGSRITHVCLWDAKMSDFVPRECR